MRSIEHAFVLASGVSATGVPVSGVPASGPRLRLTRRGRIAVVLLTLVALLLGGFLLGRGSSQASPPRAARPLPTVTVAPGETLWQIAARIAPDADRRALVDQIEALNHLSGPQVVAGQQLVLPRNR